MRVLQFIPSLNAYDGGTTTYMQQLAPGLGAEVELHICVLTPLADCVPIEGATLHTIELKLSHLLRMRRQWYRVLEEVRPEVLHVNCCWLPHCALVQYWTRCWSRRKGVPIPCFLTPHGMLEPWLIQRNYWTKKVPAIWLYQRWAVRNADGVIATAASEQEHLAALGWCRKERISLLPNGIDVASIEMKKTWAEQPLTLLFMSRLHPKKGLDLLLEAMKAFPEMRLQIAGEGETGYVSQLKELARTSGLDDRCSFLGAVYGPQKWERIQQADIVVLPSHSENFGLIVAEALASGVPVLTTHGTPWQELEERRCGWWVEASVEALSEALREAGETSRDELERMGERGRQLMEERYDVRSLVARLLQVYRNEK